MPINTKVSQQINAVIEAGESLSGVIDVRGYAHIGLLMPAAWTTAANITFQACSTATGTFVDVYTDTSVEVAVTGVAVDKAISIDLNSSALAPYPYLKIRSGTTGTPVAQVAERTIIVALKS